VGFDVLGPAIGVAGEVAVDRLVGGKRRSLAACRRAMAGWALDASASRRSASLKELLQTGRKYLRDDLPSVAGFFALVDLW